METSTIDYKINLLYDHIYNTNNNRCIIPRAISKNDLYIENIKIVYDEENIEFILKDIFGKDTLKFTEEFDGKYIYKRYSDVSYPSNIRFGSYKNPTSDIDELNRKENVNLIMKYLLSYFVVSGQAKNILVPIMNFDIPIKKIIQLVSKYPEIKGLVELYDNKKIHEYIYIEIDEHFYKQQRLDNYILDNYKSFGFEEWKQIIFSVLYILSVIHDKYPSFRHNKLDPSMLYVYVKSKKGSDAKYTLGKNNFKIKDQKFELKLANFESSWIEGLVDNKDIDDKFKTKNRYFDFHYFINILTTHPKYKNIFDYEKYDELTKFINTVLPMKYRDKHDYYQKEDLDSLIYKIV